MSQEHTGNVWCEHCGKYAPPHEHATVSLTRANDMQVGGDHYKVGGEEHWDRVHRLGLDYFQAQITKYVERWRKKGGIQDLHKARHFLDKYIEIHSAHDAGKGYVGQDSQSENLARNPLATGGAKDPLAGRRILD
jgi:hypothetical protein